MDATEAALTGAGEVMVGTGVEGGVDVAGGGVDVVGGGVDVVGAGAGQVVHCEIVEVTE